jgi:hypothetical protein
MFAAGLIDEFGSIRTIRDINLSEICDSLFGGLFMLATGPTSTIYMTGAGKRTFLQSRDWMRGATIARAAIVDGCENRTVTMDDYKYGRYSTNYAVILRQTGRGKLFLEQQQ